jgi:hypothetical protein
MFTFLVAGFGATGCALPLLLGFGGAMAAKAGEPVFFRSAASAILPWQHAEVLRAVYETLRGSGAANAMVQERDGIVEAIEASVDGRDLSVTLTPALDGRATRVAVRARSQWLQADEAMQEALLAAIMDKLKNSRRRLAFAAKLVL